MGIAHLQPIAFCLVGFLKSTKIEQGDFGLGILAIQDWGDLLKMFVHIEGTWSNKLIKQNLLHGLHFNIVLQISGI